jgi:hypothetical protein
VRISARNGAVYLAQAAGADASPVSYAASWTITIARNVIDVTPITGDGNKIYVAGLPDASGDFAGFWDDQTAQAYIAATDGLPRNLYLYPDRTSTNIFYSGMVLPDFSAAGDVTSAVSFRVTWTVAGPFGVTRGSVYQALYAPAY